MTSLRVRVYHATDLRLAESVTFSTPGAYTPVAEIVMDSGFSAVVEDGYVRSQNLWGSWLDEDGVTKLTEASGARSTSVGDVLEVLVGDAATCGALYVVAPVGFTRIDPLSVIDWQTLYR